MGALDDLAKPSGTLKLKRSEPIITIPKPIMDLGKGALSHLQDVGNMSREIVAHPGESNSVQYMLDLLNPLAKNHKAIESHAYDSAVGHNQQQNDANMTAIRERAGIQKWYEGLPHLAQGAVDTAIQMGLDPTTFAGGAGATRQLSTAVGENALPLAMKVGKHLPESITEDAAKIHDATSGGGKPIAHMFRSLAAKDGAHGVQQGKRVVAAITAQGAHQDALTRSLDVFLKPLEALPKDEQTQVLRAIHGGNVDQLPDDLQGAAKSYKLMTDSRFWLSGGKAVRARLKSQGFELPEQLQPFDKGPAGIARASNYRKNYVTMPHDLDPQEAEQVAQRFKGRNLNKISDANLRQRVNPGSVEDNPDLYLESAKSANASAARAQSRMQLRKTLTDVFGGPAKATLKKNAGTLVPEGESELSPLAKQMLLQKAKAVGKDRVGQAAFKSAVPSSVRDALVQENAKKEPALNILAGMQKAGDIGKGSIFIQPTGHMRNIGALLMAMNPAALPNALKTFADLKFGFAGPAEQYAKLGDSIEHGAIGRSFNESTPFLDALEKVPVAGKALAPVYKASSKMLWGFDKAAKKAAYDSSLKETGDPLLAGFNVGKQMVNYENAAPIAQNARFLSPFARWRFGMPVALGKSIAEHPERYLLMDRATGGALSGDQPIHTKNGDYNLISPFSEVNGGAGRYARGSASAALRGLTYPNPLQYWLHSLPGVYQVSPPNPYNIPETQGDRALFQFTGLSKKQSQKATSTTGGSALDALMKP